MDKLFTILFLLGFIIILSSLTSTADGGYDSKPRYTFDTKGNYSQFTLEREINWGIGCLNKMNGNFCHYQYDQFVWIKFDVTLFQDPTGKTVRGLAIIHGKPIQGYWSLCSHFPQFMEIDRNLCDKNWLIYSDRAVNDGCYQPLGCMSVMWHEIKHLKCDCDWHKNLKRSQTSFIWIDGFA